MLIAVIKKLRFNTLLMHMYDSVWGTRCIMPPSPYYIFETGHYVLFRSLIACTVRCIPNSTGYQRPEKYIMGTNPSTGGKKSSWRALVISWWCIYIKFLTVLSFLITTYCLTCWLTCQFKTYILKCYIFGIHVFHVQRFAIVLLWSVCIITTRMM